MKKLVLFGFSAIILMTTILVLIWLGQIKKSNETVLGLIEQSNLKIEYANTMNNAIRDRKTLLLQLLVIDDPFEQDEYIARFYEAASGYRDSRRALLEMPMSQEEKELHELLDKQASLSQPENIRAVEMFRDRAPKSKIIEVMKLSTQYQNNLLNTLGNFIYLQKTKDKEAVHYSREKFDEMVYWISILGIFAFLLSIIISRFVAQAVEDKNKELSHTNENMEKAFKKAEEATVIKSEFLATMSHEIRTPLTAIIGFAETMLFKEQTVYQRLAATKTIIRSGKHLLQIINDILDLSKIEANKLEYEKIDLSPFELLSDIKLLVQPAAVDKGLGFSINYIFPLPDKINSDPLRLKQVLINLCNNAIKFTEKGYVVINVSCDFDEEKIIFEVVDSGIGITKEQQEVIFKAYQQADSSTTRKFGGTGLGLSLSKTLAENLGGSLTAYSEFGKGSQFRLTLNDKSIATAGVVYDRSHITDAINDEHINTDSVNLNGLVLLAEDNKDNQELLLIYLRRMGLDVVTADNGQKAVNAAHNNKIDLILMDMRMPVMGGLEATILLRQQGFAKPIIALTANAMSEERKACTDAGCNDFIAKPVDIRKLTEILEKYLETKDPHEKKQKQKGMLISSLLEEDPEAISLIKRYIENLSETIDDIGSLMESKNWEKLSEVLHQLKGSGGNFGYPAISALAAQMEFQVLNENRVELNKLLFDLQEIYHQIVAGLNDE